MAASASDELPLPPTGWWGRLGRFLLRNQDVISTVLMGTAALITAWCAFEATIWGGEQSIAFAKASGARTESTRNELLDHQLLQIDVSTFLTWLDAVDREHDSDLRGAGPYHPDEMTHSGFLFKRLRPDFRPAVEAWLAQRPLINVAAPPTPFLMEEYRRPKAEKAEALMDDAEKYIKRALDANRDADAYMLVTVMSSMVILFAGLSSKLVLPVHGLALLLLACVAFLGCGLALIFLPVTFF